MSNDDTIDGRKEVQRPEAQRLLRQFLSTDGPKGSNPAYLRGWDLAFNADKHTTDCAIWKSMDGVCDCELGADHAG